VVRRRILTFMCYDNNIIVMSGLIKVAIEQTYVSVFFVNNRKSPKYSCK
jgi:hypothetical protein